MKDWFGPDPTRCRSWYGFTDIVSTVWSEIRNTAVLTDSVQETSQNRSRCQESFRLPSNAGKKQSNQLNKTSQTALHRNMQLSYKVIAHTKKQIKEQTREIHTSWCKLTECFFNCGKSVFLFHSSLVHYMFNKLWYYRKVFFVCEIVFLFYEIYCVLFCSKNTRVCIVLEHPVLDYIGIIIVFFNLKNVNRLDLLHDALMLDCI